MCHNKLWKILEVLGIQTSSKLGKELVKALYCHPAYLTYMQSTSWETLDFSSAFSKTSLNIWKFTVHVLLKPGLENFKHYFTSVWDKCNCVVVWAFFGTAFLRDWNENWPFPTCGHCWVFQISWHILCSSFTASSFRITDKILQYLSGWI